MPLLKSKCVSENTRRNETLNVIFKKTRNLSSEWMDDPLNAYELSLNFLLITTSSYKTRNNVRFLLKSRLIWHKKYFIKCYHNNWLLKNILISNWQTILIMLKSFETHLKVETQSEKALWCTRHSLRFKFSKLFIWSILWNVT